MNLKVGDKIWRKLDNLCFVIKGIRNYSMGTYYDIETFYEHNEQTCHTLETIKHIFKSKAERRADIINDL